MLFEFAAYGMPLEFEWLELVAVTAEKSPLSLPLFIRLKSLGVFAWGAFDDCTILLPS